MIKQSNQIITNHINDTDNSKKTNSGGTGSSVSTIISKPYKSPNGNKRNSPTSFILINHNNTNANLSCEIITMRISKYIATSPKLKNNNLFLISLLSKIIVNKKLKH